MCKAKARLLRPLAEALVAARSAEETVYEGMRAGFAV